MRGFVKGNATRIDGWTNSPSVKLKRTSTFCYCQLMTSCQFAPISFFISIHYINETGADMSGEIRYDKIRHGLISKTR